MTETAIATREIAPGITVNAGMTGAEIFNAHLKAAGEKPYTPPRVSFSGPEGHPPGAVLPGESAAARNPPPSPAVLEAANKPDAAAKVADFDADMRAKGLQRTDAPAAQPGEIDQAGVATLTARYKELMGALERSPQSQARDSNIVKIRAQYNEELEEFMQGRRLGEKRSEFHARRDGTAPAALSPASPEVVKAADAAAKAANAEGFTPAAAIGKELLFGYTIPQDREYVVADLVAGLRMARAGNLTQAQMEAAAGWAKA